jgi:hypothetical protein
MTHDPTRPSARGDGPLPDELLQRYFDEALSPAERADVEARLDADARMRLDALAELRTLLRGRVAAEAAGVDLSSTIDAIAAAPVAASAKPRRGFARPVAALGLLAVAAAIALWVGRTGPAPERTGSGPAVVAEGKPAEVETLEVQGAVASVFTIEKDDDGADPEPATVIWADDDDDEEQP